MLARIFIDRPVLAWVISVIIVLLGLIAAGLLPIAQYPQITPPTIRVTAVYAGASAQTVADTVAAPIEQQVNGVEGMMYMSSQSSNDGTYSLDVTFDLGTDINMAQVLVQNRVAIAQPQLPDMIKATGVTVKKRSPDILLAVSLYSDDNPNTGKPFFDQLYMSNFATIQLVDPLARLEGVGDVNIFGEQDYSMRIWLNPEQMATRNVTADDIIAVLREQNVQVAAGQIGEEPVPPGQAFQFTMTTLGRLLTANQFADIVVKSGNNGEVVYLKDVARIRLGAKSQDTRSFMDGKESAGIGIFQLPGSNALDVGQRVKAKMSELERRFPPGLHYAIRYDTTPFIQQSVDEVFITLRDAVFLVAAVVLLFLQDWKSLILPLIDVGVSLIGTFAVMELLGFSLNNLTLFGLVLAIGIVVDDAIVVLENIERWMDRGLAVREATIRAMDEITGPVVAITLVLSSVFLPSAFLTGITGEFFRQFALTISAAMLISALNALTMTPARAASIFAARTPGKRGQQGKEPLPWWFFGLPAGFLGVWLGHEAFIHWLGLPNAEQGGSNHLKATLVNYAMDIALFIPGAVAGGIVGWFIIGPVNWALLKVFAAFNWAFDRVVGIYGRTVGWLLRLSLIVLLVYVGLVAVTGYGFYRIPSGFIPNQDKGYLIANIQLPDAAALERSVEVTQQVDEIVRSTPGVAHTVAIPGMSFVQNANSSNYASMFIILVPFPDRTRADLSGDALAAKLRVRFAKEVPQAVVSVFGPPPVQGLGNAGGFRMMVEATGGTSLNILEAESNNLAAQANHLPGLVGVFNSFRAHSPQLYVDIDRTQCKSMQIPLTNVFDTLQVFMGSYYVNDFNEFGRTWQVNLEAEAGYRTSPEFLKQMRVRNAAGNMVPLGSLLSVKRTTGPVTITRFNMFPSAAVYGASRPDVSTGDVLSMMSGLAERDLSRTMTYEWADISYLQNQASQIVEFRDLRRNPFSAFVLGALLVFFVLAGLYESWSTPFAVILVVPMCLSSAIAGVALARSDINIFVQVGFVVLVGLAAKNAILVVDFALDREREGKTIFDATVEAAETRLRPILMTSFAFVLGVLPLVYAAGAGAEMRRALGTAVFSGMLGVTLFGIFLTPVFYYVIRGLIRPKGPHAVEGDAQPTPPPDYHQSGVRREQ